MAEGNANTIKSLGPLLKTVTSDKGIVKKRRYLLKRKKK